MASIGIPIIETGHFLVDTNNLHKSLNLVHTGTETETNLFDKTPNSTYNTYSLALYNIATIKSS